MQFVKYLRDAVRHGAVTCSIRIWTRPHVTAGNRYRMEDGEIEIDEVVPITLDDITPDLARTSGFKSVPDLLRVAKHGPGDHVYLIRFHFIPLQDSDATRTASPRRRSLTNRPALRRRRRKG